MTAHLTDEQVTDVLLGDGDAAGEHLECCEVCQAETERLRGTLARFGNTMRAQLIFRSVRPAVRRLTLRWTLVPALLALVAALMLLFPRNEPQPSISQDEADNQFLLNLDSDMRRGTPRALEPAAALVPEENRSRGQAVAR